MDCGIFQRKTNRHSPSMKRTILGLVSLMLITASGMTFAQSTKDQRKERQELAKATKKELGEKASKAARNEAKKLGKEGWKTAQRN